MPGRTGWSSGWPLRSAAMHSRSADPNCGYAVRRLTAFQPQLGAAGMDAAPSFSASLPRLSRVLAVAFAAGLLAPAVAAADPRIQEVTLTNSGIAGEPLGIDVTAVDPSAPVTAVDVRF